MAKIVITIEDVISGPCAGQVIWSMRMSGDPEAAPTAQTPAEELALRAASPLANARNTTEVEP